MRVTKQGVFYALASPDGTFLYYTKAHEEITAIKRVPISGGEETDVAEGVFKRSFAVASRVCALRHIGFTPVKGVSRVLGKLA